MPTNPVNLGIRRIAQIIRVLAVAGHSGILLFCGWEIGECWATGNWRGVVVFVVLFAWNIAILHDFLLKEPTS